MNGTGFYCIMAVAFITTFLDVDGQLIQLVPASQSRMKKKVQIKRKYYRLDVDWNNAPCNLNPGQTPPNQLGWWKGGLLEEPHYENSDRTGHTTRSGTLHVTEEMPYGTAVTRTYWKCANKLESSCTIAMAQTYYDFCDTMTSLSKPWSLLFTAIDNPPVQCPISTANYTVKDELLADSYFERMLEDASLTSAFVRRKIEWLGNGKVLLCSGLSAEISISYTKSGSYKIVKK